VTAKRLKRIFGALITSRLRRHTITPDVHYLQAEFVQLVNGIQRARTDVVHPGRTLP
jgi:hypothetical protein